ncbi:MAG TPA: ApaG domain, partial [Luteimonas sp.]|nr:ApaG domain [Luteimonas sp.]
MNETADYTLEIQIATRFLDEESAPEDDRYVFAYTIRIRNLGKLPAQLVSRRWLITDANGKVEEVRGEGVVGEQPRIEPGE